MVEHPGASLRIDRPSMPVASRSIPSGASRRSERYWRENPKPVEVEQLLGYWAMWRERIGPSNLDVRQGRRLGSSDLVPRAAEQGLDIALARGRPVEDSLANGALQRVFGDRDNAQSSARYTVAR